jgi:hypothetical protein
MKRGFVSAIAVLLCLLVVGMVVGREKCRLGNFHWDICAWMGIPPAGGSLSLTADARPLMLTEMFGDECASSAIIGAKSMAQTELQNVDGQGAARKAVLGGSTSSECRCPTGFSFLNFKVSLIVAGPRRPQKLHTPDWKARIPHRWS